MSRLRPLHKASPNVARLLRQALKRHQKGHLSGAAKLYTAVLEHQPKHFDALHFLGC